MKGKFLFLPLFIVFIFSQNLTAQTARERAVQVSATVYESPARVVFDWPADPTASGYTVHKKALTDTSWGTPIANLPSDAVSFTDPDVGIGQAYEYAFFKKAFEDIVQTVCVPSGATLRFEITDMFDIGLCCSFGHGGYKIEGCGQTYTEGADFGSFNSDIFTVCNDSPCTDVTITITPDIFPNSTWWTLKDNWTGLELANSGIPGSFITERPKYGYIYAGIQVPPLESRGTILLVGESAISGSLTDEIDQTVTDFIMDGWKVKRLTVNANDQVTSVKNSIRQIWQATPDLTAVFLLGHVPVPYAGDIFPDTHTEHRGAWSADTYYGEMDGTWTDNSANRATAFFARNHNVPGDGKFDQSAIPSKMELQVGRVDMFNLNAFELSETELLRNYLNKNHNFKSGNLFFEKRALVDDNFKEFFAAPAASAYRNFAALLGANKTFEVDYLTSLNSSSYLWAYGCGSGSHVSSEGVATTTQLAASNLQNVFNVFFGSQFGDWDNENNFLRAPLAQGATLTNCWAGSPAWQFHHMAMGHPIGYSAIRTMNSDINDYLPGPQLVHLGLMGDPTLRMHPVKPVSDVAITNSGNNTSTITWNPPSGEDVWGYNIYRANTLNNDYTRLNSEPVNSNSYEDIPALGNNVYMVRTVKLEESGSGTYFNMALGKVDSIFFDQPLSIDLNEFTVIQNDCNNQIIWKMDQVEEVAFFEVEKSSDGKDFTKFNTIRPNGNYEYETIDSNTKDNLYYRLKTYYQDEHFEYSTIISMENDCHTSKYDIKAFPNPASFGQNELTVEFTTISNKAQISMLDVNGKIHFDQKIDTKHGANDFLIDISSLANGVYFIQLKDEHAANRYLKFIRSDIR